VDVSVQEVVQSSSRRRTLFAIWGFFLGAPRRLVTCTRLAASRGCPLSPESGASFNQRLVPYSSGLGDFDLLFFTESCLHTSKVSGVVLRHLKTGLCFPPSIRASNHPIDPTPPPGGAVPHQVRSRRTAISPHIPLWCDIRLIFVSDGSQRLSKATSLNSLPRTSNMNRPGGLFLSCSSEAHIPLALTSRGCRWPNPAVLL
jgi:hypothetical protein